jgi:predicted transcriptional regulator of viral defense system
MNELYLKYRKQGVFRREQLARDFEGQDVKELLHAAKVASPPAIKSISGRRGIYFVVEPGEDYKRAAADTTKLAASIAPGAIICYASALNFHGKSHSIHNIYYIATKRKFRDLTYQGVRYQNVTLPHRDISIDKIPYKGMVVEVASLERTLVDCLRSFKYAGGFEQLFRSFEGVPYVNSTKIEECLSSFASPVLYARVGLFLQFFRSRWGISDAVLYRIRQRIPKHPDYFLGREAKTGKLIIEWNLIVPEDVLGMGRYHGG